MKSGYTFTPHGRDGVKYSPDIIVIPYNQLLGKTE